MVDTVYGPVCKYVCYHATVRETGCSCCMKLPGKIGNGVGIMLLKQRHCEVAAPCNEAQGEVCCAWRHTFYLLLENVL